MKTLLLMALLLPLGAAAQAPASPPAAPAGSIVLLDGTSLPVDPGTQRICYTGIVEAPGLTKDQLYTRAQEWIAKTYRSANAVLQMQDKEAGTLVAKGGTAYFVRSYPGGSIRHTLSVYSKDGRYKYVLTDLEHTAIAVKNVYSGGALENPKGEIMMFGTKKQWDDVRRAADADAKRLVNELQAAMTTKAASDF